MGCILEDLALAEFHVIKTAANFMGLFIMEIKDLQSLNIFHSFFPQPVSL